MNDTDYETDEAAAAAPPDDEEDNNNDDDDDEEQFTFAPAPQPPHHQYHHHHHHHHPQQQQQPPPISTVFITEKFTYNFDFPNQPHYGYFEASNENIVLSFPEPYTYTHIPKFPYTQSVQLLINNKRFFNYSWLPIYTVNDFYKVKDMLAKLFETFSHKIAQQPPNQSMVVSAGQNKHFNELYTVAESPHYILNCFEDPYVSSISLDFKLDSPPPPAEMFTPPLTPVHVKIYIGSTLIFCTERDILPMVPVATMHFLTQFILHKLIKT